MRVVGSTQQIEALAGGRSRQWPIAEGEVGEGVREQAEEETAAKGQPAVERLESN